MALNSPRPPDRSAAAYLMRNSIILNDSMVTMLPSGPSHGLSGPCLSSLHEFRAATNNTRHPFYAPVLESSDATVDHDDGIRFEHSSHHAEKKRRLTNEQVKSLEVNFEIESKLEPDRKAQLAQQLGLQPRQVAVWFQNRRARYKTKQLERDYDILKVQYDAVRSEKDKLEAEVARLRELLSAQGKEISSQLEQTPGTPLEENAENQAVEQAHVNGSPSFQSDDAISKQVIIPLKQPVAEGFDASSDSDQTEIVDAASTIPKEEYNIPEQFISQHAAKFSLYNPQFFHQIAVKMEEGFLQAEDLCNDNYFHSIDYQASDSMLCFNWQDQA